MKRYMRNFLYSFVFTVSLSACTEAPPATAVPDLTYGNYKAVSLHVGRIEIVDRYVPPMKAPHVEHAFKTPPYLAVHQLLQEKLIATGGDTVLRAYIDDASVVEQKLIKDRGITSIFDREPSEKYNGKIVLHFELAQEKAPDIVTARAEVSADRHKTVLEGISPAERDRAYFEMTESMINDINNGLQTVVKSTFYGQ